MSTTKVTDALRNVTAVDASKITTGTVDVARLPSTVLNSNVDADLTPAHQGIANLGLIMATEHDKVAFNLTGSFIDIFQDNSGIATETNVDRNASEYVSSTTESFGTTTTGTSKAARFEADTTQITDDTTWSSFSRDGGSNALYVQQGGTSSEIASFRKGALGAGQGTEVLGVKANGIVVNGTIQGQHVANDGTAGFTGTASNPTSFTIKNGLITAIS